MRGSARLRTAALVGIAALSVGSLLSVDRLGRGIEEQLGTPFLFHLRGPLPPPPDVVIVAEDQESATALGLPLGQRPWPRALHARAITKLTALGAKVIAFDFMFSRPDPGNDDAFATSMRRAGNVVLLRGLERRVVGPKSSIEIDEAIEPLPKLAEAAAATAPFPLPKVPARVDRFWTFHGILGKPTLPSVMLQLASRDIERRWLTLLASEPSVPRFTVEDWTGPHLAIAMERLHAFLRANPAAVRNLRTRLRAEPWGVRDKRRFAALISLYAGSNSRLINFRGPAGTIRIINYATLLSGAASPNSPPVGDLSGKAVIVGALELHSASQVDSYDTVYSGTNGINVSGAEIAATAFADLAEQASPDRPIEVAWTEIFLVALGLAAAAAVGRVSVLLAQGGMTAVAVLTAGWYAFSTQDWLLPIAGPIFFQVPIGILAGTAYLRVDEYRQRRRMTRAARQYLPEEVVRILSSGPLSAPPSLVGDVGFSVCLCSDIAGFTALSERMSPKALQQLLNQYFKGLFEVMQRHGGVISDVAGDGVMCIWRTQVDSPSAGRNAVAAALDLVRTVDQFNVAHPTETMPTRIGIHAGSAVFGVVGGSGRFASTIVGDVANTASRIEELNKQLGTKVLASDAALQEVTNFVLRPLGAFLLAGKSERIKIFEVLGGIGDSNAIALAEAFSRAFEAFQSHSWDDAIALFEGLLHTYPNDGPSRYFLSSAMAQHQAVTQLGPRA